MAPKPALHIPCFWSVIQELKKRRAPFSRSFVRDQSASLTLLCAGITERLYTWGLYELSVCWYVFICVVQCVAMCIFNTGQCLYLYVAMLDCLKTNIFRTNKSKRLLKNLKNMQFNSILLTLYLYFRGKHCATILTWQRHVTGSLLIQILLSK